MKRIHFPRLRTIWLLLMILLLLPSLVFTIRMRSVTRDEAEAAARDDVMRVVRIAAERHQRMIESTQQVLFMMGRLPAFKSGDLEACSRLAADLIRQYPRYANLGLANLDGTIAASGISLQHEVNVWERSWFARLARDPELRSGDYHLDEISGKPVAVLSHPVLDNSGRLKFIAFAALDLDWGLRIFDAAHLPHGSVMTVSDQTGKILARTLEPAKWTGSAGPEAGILKTLSSGNEAAGMDLGADGVRRFYAGTPLHGGEKGSTVSVSAGIPASAIYARADQSTTRNLTILMLTAALAFAAMWLIGETYIGRGLRALGEDARRLANGEHNARAVSRTEAAELREVSHDFERLADSIQARAESDQRRLAGAQESVDRQTALVELLHKSEQSLRNALEEASQKIAEYVQTEGVLREEIQHLKEVLRSTAVENVQISRSEEMLRLREVAYKQSLESSAGEIARLKETLAETCEKLRHAEQQRTPVE